MSVEVVSTPTSNPNVCSHADAGREALISTHTVGIQRPREVRSSRSLSTQKSPKIRTVKIKLAMIGGMRFYRAVSTGSVMEIPPLLILAKGFHDPSLVMACLLFHLPSRKAR